MMKKLICKMFGHRMFFDTTDVTGPSTCKRCGLKNRHEFVWPYTSRGTKDE